MTPSAHFQSIFFPDEDEAEEPKNRANGVQMQTHYFMDNSETSSPHEISVSKSLNNSNVFYNADIEQYALTEGNNQKSQ